MSVQVRGTVSTCSTAKGPQAAAAGAGTARSLLVSLGYHRLCDPWFDQASCGVVAL